ncbi:hypothetical protein CDEF62S_01809 [Castellaniella defragrans]
MLSVANNGVIVASVIEPTKNAQGVIRENALVTVYRSEDRGVTWTSMGVPSTRETLPDGREVDLGRVFRRPVQSAWGLAGGPE